MTFLTKSEIKQLLASLSSDELQNAKLCLSPVNSGLACYIGGSSVPTEAMVIHLTIYKANRNDQRG